MRHFGARAILASLLAVGAVAAHAQAWPAKPVRLVVPFGPGSADILARTIAPQVSTSLGQQFVVENRPGAGGAAGTEMIAKAPADGYTLLFGSAAANAVNPSLMKVNYDPVKDFAPVILLASIPNIVIVNPQSGWSTVPQIVAAAKAKPGTLTYASNGPGTSGHMSAAMFEMLTGTKLVHVPYKGTSEGIIAVARGDVNLMFANMPPAQPLIRDGRVRAVAATTAQRLPAFPELPTLAESGVAGYEVTTWFSVFAPANTPRDIVMRLNKDIGAALNHPDTREKLTAQGFTIGGGTPEDLGRLLQSELAKWARVVRETGAKAE